MSKETGTKSLASNRKALHEYFVVERFEAGIVLTGTEIKSVRAGKISLQESYARIENGEVWLVGAHVAPYAQGSRENPDPVRRRKLLLHRDEILKLQRKVGEKGFTLVPLRVYLKGNRAKLELALAKGKKSYDKREAIAERDADREMSRAVRREERGDFRER